jgi:hypothetical protein
MCKRLAFAGPWRVILRVCKVRWRGQDLFALACEDLEGFVAKHRNGQYLSGGEERSWLKLRNQLYSQMMGRNKLFDRKANRPRLGELRVGMR